VGIDFVEGLFEGGWSSVVAWQGCGETWAEETIVGAGEEEGGAEAGVSDAVAVGVWQAFDHAVEPQAAELVGDRTLPECIGLAAAEVGQMVTQIGPAKALWQQTE
jgi:hypothetical protein